MRKAAGWVAGVIIGAGLVWFAGLLWFAATLPQRVPDAETRTDAIVVLTGGSERIETGVKLLADGRADRLYISGVGGKARTDEVLARMATNPDLKARVSIGEALNTPGNAAETAAWARQHGVASIRLVTAGYHMRRSLLELHRAMPAATIIPHPVFPAHVKTDWWRWPGTASLIAREYSKFALTWLWQNLGFEDDLPITRSAGAGLGLIKPAKADRIAGA
jgi:uncharacterized SAM-binding protein YcdF (DUF218 family)